MSSEAETLSDPPATPAEPETASDIEIRTMSASAWRRDAAALVDTQLWLFGYDICRPEGNLLVSMGCERIAAPPSTDYSSCYRVKLAGGQRLTLRGFGVMCEDGAGSLAVFLHRDAFRVSWLEPTAGFLPWQVHDLPRQSGVPEALRDDAARLVSRTAEWIAEYEVAVAQQLGDAYRVEAMTERKAKLPKAPIARRLSWPRIASDLIDRPELIHTRSSRKPKQRRAGKAL